MNLTEMDHHTRAARRVRFASGRSEQRARVRTDATRKRVGRARECPPEARRGVGAPRCLFLERQETRARYSVPFVFLLEGAAEGEKPSPSPKNIDAANPGVLPCAESRGEAAAGLTTTSAPRPVRLSISRPADRLSTHRPERTFNLINRAA